MNKKYILLGILTAVIGSCAALWVYREDIALYLLRGNTEKEEQELKRHIRSISESTSKIETETKTQVVIYRDRVVKEIGALPPDDVVNLLNYELVLFRSMDARSEGMDGK